MGRYTLLDDPKVDEQIDFQLSLIVKAIRESIDDELVSIILFGGFGRGEGSIKYLDDETIFPLKDYDILIIVKKNLSQLQINQIYEKAYAELNYTNPQQNIFEFKEFVLDFTIKTLSEFAMFPDIAIYETKVASTLLYGDDVREQIPWMVQDIPLVNGWRLIFEKMTGLIGHFPQELLNENFIDKKSIQLLYYECNKTYIEICTSLCLLMDCYVPSYHKRAQLFSSNFEKKLPKLHFLLPSLPDLVVKATMIKLNSTFEDITADPLDLWFKVRNDLLIVAKFYLENLLKIQMEAFSDFQKKEILLLRKKYFKHILTALIGKKLKSESSFLAYLLNPFLQFYINLRYFLRYYSNNSGLFFGFFRFPFTSINIVLHHLAFFTLLSVDEDGNIVDEHFAVVVKTLKKLYPTSKFETFEAVRTQYLLTYKNLTLH